ncbi:MAG TPA: acyloxyacyl hydrolase, partial [Thermoanaerobaculia bacterium]
SIWRPYVELAAGPLYATGRVPAAGSRANFLVQPGAGITHPIKAVGPWSAVLGLRVVHISNAGTYRRNPSWNFWGIVVGLRKFGASAEAR